MKRLIAISLLLFSVAAAAQNLNFKTAPVQDAASTVAWTSATALNTALKITVTNRSSVSVYYNPSAGSVTGGVIAFQRSQDDSVYSPVFCAGADGTNNGTQFTLGASAQEWTCAVGSATKFQAKLTTQVAGAGTANISITASASVPNAAATVIASSALPTGAATEATLSALNSKIPASPAQDRTTAAAPGAVRLSDGAAFYKPTTPSDTQPVSAAALPLPSGAATETTLAAMNTKIPASPATDRSTAAAPFATRLTDGTSFYKGTTPADTQPISAAALPLPSGAAQDATLTGGTQKAIARGGAKGSTTAADVTSTPAGANHQPLDVAINDAAGVQLGVPSAPIQVSLANTAANGTAVKTDGSAVTQPVSAAALPLPSGASTSAKQPALGTAGAPSADVITIQGAASMTAVKTDGSGVTQPVSIAGNVATTDAATSATGSAVPAKASYTGGSDGTNLVGYFVDPCQRGAKSYAVINMSTATTTRIIAPVAAKKNYICSVVIVAGAADNVAIVEGTGGTCGTATAGMAGGTTAASGFNLAANGGLTLGNGYSSVLASAGSNVDTCLVTSAAAQLSGTITYVQF